jgi:hypothetical protein
VGEIKKTNDSTTNVRFATTYVGKKCSGGLSNSEKKGLNVRKAVQMDDPSFYLKHNAGALHGTIGIKVGVMEIVPG